MVIYPKLTSVNWVPLVEPINSYYMVIFADLRENLISTRDNVQKFHELWVVALFLAESDVQEDMEIVCQHFMMRSKETTHIVTTPHHTTT